MHHKTASVLALVVVASVMSGCGYGAPAVAPAYNAIKEPLVTGGFAVGPRTFKEYKFVVTSAMSKPRLEGTFSASGGSGNDIEVSVLDESQFANWQKRRAFDATFESGRVTDATLNVTVPESPATYYLVFSNRFSLFSNKAVTASVQLCYDLAAASTTSGRRGYDGNKRQ